MGMSRAERFQRNTGGVLLGAAALGYFLNPLMAFANPFFLSIGGVALFVAIIGLYNCHVLPNMSKGMIAFAYATLIVAGFILLPTFWFADDNRASVADQCRKLQNEIIQGQAVAPAGKSVSPAHDAFTALRCIPVDLTS